MTLKDFLKAWKECNKTHKNGDLRRDKGKECEDFLCENYGLKKDEFDEIMLELENSKELEWWNDYLFEYFLDKIDENNPNALAIKERFKLDELSLAERKKLLENDNFISILDEFWQSDIW